MFYIIGNPRSGTTLLRLLLTTNSEIHIPPECGFMIWLKDKYSSKKNFTVTKTFVCDLLKTKKFNFWHIKKNDLEHMFTNKIFNNYFELCLEIYKLHMKKTGKNAKIIGDKNNFYLHHISELNELDLNSKFIHIVRDGRDVAHSYLKINEDKIVSQYKPNLPKTIEKIAHDWIKNINLIENSLAKIDNHRKINIRYEDLVSNTQKELKKITNFLKVNYSSEMLHFYKHNNEPEEFFQWKKKTKLRIDDKSVGNYKKIKLNEVSKFEKISYNELKLYNYI